MRVCVCIVYMCHCAVRWVRCAVVKKISSPLQLPNGTASSEMMNFHPDTIAPQQPQTEKFGFCLLCISTNYHLRRSTVWTDNNIRSQGWVWSQSLFIVCLICAYTYLLYVNRVLCILRNLLTNEKIEFSSLSLYICIDTILYHHYQHHVLKASHWKTVRCSFYKDLQLHTPHIKCYRFTYMCGIFCVI